MSRNTVQENRTRIDRHHIVTNICKCDMDPVDPKIPLCILVCSMLESGDESFEMESPGAHLRSR